MYRIFFIVFFIIPFSIHSQKTKLKINSIEFAIYRYNSMYSDVKDKADVILYCSVKKDGSVQVQKNYNGNVKIYYTRLADEIVSNINFYFTTYKSLKNCYEAGMPEKGVIYGAQEYSYVRLINSANKIESASYLDKFMKESFNDLVLSLYSDKNLGFDAKAIVTPEIEKRITEQHRITKYLTTAGGPPPQEL